jgi:hypothetical protein
MILDTLIVHHPTSNRDRPILVPAIGLLSLADCLDRHGIRAQVVHLGVEDPAFDVVDYAAASGVRVFGLSVHWFFQLPDSLELARRLKQRHPEILVVLGGFTASFFASEIIAKHPYVDVIVRGDGEVPFRRLCEVFLSRGERDFSGVPNLVFRGVGDSVEQTPFTYRMDTAGFGQLRSTNVKLMKSHEAWFRLPMYPSQRFKQHFDFERNGYLCIGPTRGCVLSCPLCGGNREAQHRVFRRDKLLFQPVDGVVENIREAMPYGYRNFYLCSDPAPRSTYYLELFRRLREERLDLGFLFECWSLPSREFVDGFSKTFARGMLILSPDSVDEDVRRRTKGPFAYSNAELLERLAYIWSRGIVTQTFFGFFLPGDTPDTVAKTRRFAHELESEVNEVFYLAFSTDPGSPIHLHPAEHDVVLHLSSLDEYLTALPRKRLSPNLLAHRPRCMSQEVAEDLTAQITLDQLLHKMFPLSMRMLRSIGASSDRAHSTLEAVLASLSVDIRSRGAPPPTKLLLEKMLDHFHDAEGDSAAWRALRDLARFEGQPYVLMEQHFSGLGRHYTSTCRELTLSSEEARCFASRKDAVSSLQRFDCDVLGLAADLSPKPAPCDTALDFTAGRSAISTPFPPSLGCDCRMPRK